MSLPHDWPQRSAALDPQRSFIVEAAAGSGKTALLIQRFLKLLALADEPEEIVAITFTRKATQEMRNKLFTLLREAQQSQIAGAKADKSGSRLARFHRELALAVLRRDQERAWKLLAQPQRIRIATIDSFSAEIAGRLPLFARLGGNLSPTERPESLYRTAARRTIEHLADGTALGAAVRTLLVQHDNDLQRCLDMLVRMLACRTQWKTLLGHEHLDNPETEHHLRAALQAAPAHAISECMQIVRLYLTEEDCKQLHDLLRFAAETRNELAEDPRSPCEHDFSIASAERWRGIANMVLLANGKARLLSQVNKTHGFPIDSDEKAQLLEFLATHRGNQQLIECFHAMRTMPAAAYSEEHWELIKAYVRVLTQAVAELKVTFAREGTVDFSEVALAAVSALTDSGGATEIAAAFGTRIRHLLVDEMQDTSGIQYELLRALTGGWDLSSQTIFMVGDPKQSIYAFRQAEVHRFREMQLDGLGPLRLEAIVLTTNFRSQESLVKKWNEGFKTIFTQKRPEDIPFSEATAQRPALHGANMQVHPCIIEDDSQESKLRAEHEQARKICAIIRARIDAHQSVKPPRIAVLARARTHLSVLLEEFRRHGIPYRALDIDALGAVQEVRDVVALTRALLHPSDRIAWLAILRAPWCGLTLADLHCLCHGDAEDAKSACVGELLGHDVSALAEDGQIRCARASEVMAATLKMRDRSSLASLVERAWHSLGGPACATAQERANIERYFEFLRDVEREDALSDFRALEERLESFYAQPQTFDEGETVVDVLTIHGAKGLEWDIVFIPELQRTATPDSARLLNWIEYPAIEDGIVLAASGETRDDDPFYRWFCEMRRQQNEAERKRLFYVACTRAANELHLFGTLSLDSEGQCASPRSDSLLSTGWPMLETSFIEAATAKGRGRRRAHSNIVLFPDEAVTGVLPAMAATASDVVQLNQRRLPAGWQPAASPPPLHWYSEKRTSRSAVPEQPFARAEGSILARTTGEAIHRFLERMTHDFAAGATLTEVQARLASGAIAAVVRSLGVAPEAQTIVVSNINTALRKSLQDPIAQWLLGVHRDSVTEGAINATVDGVFRNVRVDRAFLAGSVPLESGEDTLWLVDYKTGENGRVRLDEFLHAQQQFYTPQLDTYARVLRPFFPQARTIRLGLYYPSLSKFQHWAWTGEDDPR